MEIDAFNFSIPPLLFITDDFINTTTLCFLSDKGLRPAPFGFVSLCFLIITMQY